MTTAPFTDLANAETLVELHGDVLRFVGSWKKGLAWDGQRWCLDETGYWDRAAIQTVRAMLRASYDAIREADLAESDDDLAQSKKTAKRSMSWAIESQSAKRLNSMRTLAQKAEVLSLSHERLDSDPWLLNVQNGTIDLKTGQLREHRREDLITKLAPVDFDPDAKAPTWLSFLDRAMAGSQELMGFLQRMIGYSLTGSVQEHVLGFFFGGGANGKSTFLSTIHTMLGDYASPAPRGMLFRGKGDRHPTELASLYGRRFVTCSEVEEGVFFDEGLTKDLTGGDPIECRRMREDFWTFQPTHKIFVAGNHKPSVRGDDEGIWRRMRLIPWVVTIPAGERDVLLSQKLRAELPGILRWAVDGCLEWQRIGLGEPPSVKGATAEYRAENDVLGEFLRLRVVFTPDATIARKELREAYEGHCRDSGLEPYGAKRFASRLRENGVQPTTVRRGVSVVDGWRGARMASDAEREAASRWGVVTSSGQPANGAPGRNGSHVSDTSPYVPSDDQETFSDFVEKQVMSRT